MWWFFALMMLNSYTANLAAFLTNSRQGNSISSAEDLAAQNKIKYGAMAGGSTMGFFRDSNFSTYQKMWTAMESASPSVFTKTNDEGVERVQKGKNLYAYRPFLKEIKLSTDNCLILHCAPDNLLKILEQANELKMLGEYQVCI